MRILVTGGAGYIGSVVCEYLSKTHHVTAIDNLSAGYKKLVVPQVTFFQIDILNIKKLSNLFKKHKFDLVIHLAAKVVVSESVTNPQEYCTHNVTGTTNLLQIMHQHNVKNIVFASSAAVYGNSIKTPIQESAPKLPINPYGQTKLVAEQAIQKTRLNYVILRFFNVAGASKSLRCGMLKPSPTLLIPAVNKQILSKKIPAIYGNKYATKDGTCIRDYVHVIDIAIACKKAIKLLIKQKSGIFNIGSGHGYSVLQVVTLANKLNRVSNNYTIKSPRLGDPAVLLTCNKLVKKTLK
jgi:UDP-glucose 4-epimerase